MADNRTILPPSVGTTLKIAVSADLGEYHMDDVDFSCCFYSQYIRNKVVINKGDEKMIKIDEDTYVAVIDTRLIGAGQYYMKFTAFLPDIDLESGLREEVVTVKLNLPPIEN